MTNQRTVIAAVEPRRYQDSYTEICLKVWFEELSEPVLFIASPFDHERHGKALWIRAMAGEFGSIEVIPKPSPQPLQKDAMELLEQKFKSPLLLTGVAHDDNQHDD